MHAIGIDLGGTKITGAIFDKDGTLLMKVAHLLENRKGSEVGQLVIQTIDELLLQDKDRSIEAIGVCVPGISDSKTNLVWAPNIPDWDHYPLQQEIEEHLEGQRIAVAIDSDRSCYILGETWKGSAKGCQNAVFIAVGTGVGMGILVDGHILHGHADIVGAAGWMALESQWEDEYEFYGCFETDASGDGIGRCARRTIRKGLYRESSLYNKEIESITAHDVFDAYDQQDALGVYVIERAIKLWGMAAANVISLLNPERIIWGGGVFGPARQLLDRIYDEACRWAQPIASKQVAFEASHLCGDAGLYGAGRLAFHELNTYDYVP